MQTEGSFIGLQELHKSQALATRLLRVGTSTHSIEEYQETEQIYYYRV